MDTGINVDNHAEIDGVPPVNAKPYNFIRSTATPPEQSGGTITKSTVILSEAKDLHYFGLFFIVIVIASEAREQIYLLPTENYIIICYIIICYPVRTQQCCFHTCELVDSFTR